jgi:NADH-quinone oxidoreductase subunit J
MTGPDAVFALASAAAVASTVLAVTRKNPVYSAAWMMASLFAVAVVYLLLHATFLFVVQVLLYAGAILVLFVFVIMLLNPGPQDLEGDRPPPWVRMAAAVFAAALFVALARATIYDVAATPAFTASESQTLDDIRFGSTEWIGATLYDRYLVAFEAISLLVVAAMAAVILLAKKRLEPAEEALADLLGGPPAAGGGNGDGHGQALLRGATPHGPALAEPPPKPRATVHVGGGH